jgi:hypothetical protein
MSNTQDYINKMLAEKDANTNLYNLSSESKVSIWRNFMYVVAFIANFVRELQDVHETEVSALIDNQKLTNLNYYREVVFNYRDGHPFGRETLSYTGTYTDEEIEAAKVVKRAAADETTENGIKKISLKLATEVDSELQELEENTLNRIKEYVFINAPAGTNLSIISIRPDELKLEVDVYIDPQVLTTSGVRVDGTSNDVIATAVDEFFADQNFKFDGELVLSLLEDKIQAVQGVQDRSVRFKTVAANHTVPAVWETVTERYTAYSGYYKVLELKVNHLIK